MRAAWPAALGALLGALVSLRTIVSFTDMPWFDVDPMLDPQSFPGLGPSGSLLIDAGIAGVSALLVGLFAGRAAVLVTIASLVVVAPRIGSERSIGELGWRGADWIAAWCACAAAVAVARNARQPARLAWSALVSVMLGACCLWLARGAWQWFHEHGSTMAYFQDQAREAFFQDRGWDPEGPQALSYERRLMQREMIGWFGLANIFSGVMAVAAIALAGLPRLGDRRGVSWGLLSAACAAAVLANGGKGAIVAMALGFSAMLLLGVTRWRPWGLAAIALGLVGLSAMAAWLRAVALAPWMQGERSLLFRWQYQRTAWQAWLERPWSGTGPEGFQDASARLRPDDAVEIVRSSHAAFVDWVSQLGAGGLVWIAAALAILSWSARGAAVEREPLPAPQARDGWAQRCAMLAALAAALVGIVIEAPSLDPAAALVRLVGGAAWAGAAVTLLPRLWSARGSGARMLFPAALAMLCHAQVEMTLWNPGSVPWLLAMLGAAVPPHAIDAREQERAPDRWPRAIGAIVCVLVACACLLRGASAARAERGLEAAAERLMLEMRASSGLLPEQARRHAAAAVAPWSRLIESEQWLRAADAAGPTSATGQSDLVAATRAADQAVESGSGLVRASRLDALHAAAHAWERRAWTSGSRQDLEAALQRAIAVTAFDAGSASAWLRAARLADALGKPESSGHATQALRRDDAMSLDPLIRLSARDRAEAARLAGLSDPKPAGSP
jgi:hypothetical protein